MVLFVRVYGFEELYGIDIRGYALGYLFGVAHGMYDSCGSVGYVAPGKNTLSCGHAVRCLAGKYITFLVDFDSVGCRYDS